MGKTLAGTTRRKKIYIYLGTGIYMIFCRLKRGYRGALMNKIMLIYIRMKSGSLIKNLTFLSIFLVLLDNGKRKY